VEWPAKRSYLGLVAVGVQEQAEDILVPLPLRYCLTFSYIPLSSHYLPPQNSGPRNTFYCLGHFKNVYDDDDDDDELCEQNEIWLNLILILNLIHGVNVMWSMTHTCEQFYGHMKSRMCN